ncbi:hypothetical protein ABK040_013634 [Willaertia magna]
MLLLYFIGFFAIILTIILIIDNYKLSLINTSPITQIHQSPTIVKEEKIIYNNLLKELNLDILIEITKYFTNIQEYINLAKINKFYYKMLMSQNILSTCEIFKCQKIFLNKNIPNKIKYLNVINRAKNNIDFINKFTNLKFLKIEERIYCNSVLYNIENDNNEINRLNDNHLKNLLNLEELYLEKCKFIFGSSFKYLNKLKKLQINTCNNINGEFLKDLQNLKYLKIIYCNNFDLNYLLELKELLINLKIYYTKLEGKEEIINQLQNLQKLKIVNCGTINYFVFNEKIKKLLE